MYYLGKHKGTPDDSYTHSSFHMESFNKNNIPSYMRRRILAYGTDEEMCLLEHECLKNRKQKKWDRYYNVHMGDPRYVDQCGENNPMYKHGMSNDIEWRRKRDREYHNRNKEERNQKSREWRKNNIEYAKESGRKRDKERYYNDPEYREKQIETSAKTHKKRMEDPEYREKYLAKRREYHHNHKEDRQEYYQKNKERIIEKGKEWQKNNPDKCREYALKSYYKNREKVLEKNKKWREENKEYLREYRKKLNARKKAERLASGATLPI